MPRAPTKPAEHCDPNIKAKGQDEPAPPPGPGQAALYDFLAQEIGEDAAKAWWQWFTTSYPQWAREGWVRIDKARAACP